jgi:hypothetical protein
MSPAIVADGRKRLELALAGKMKLRRAEIAREVEARYADAGLSAGFWRRLLIRRRIRQEVAATLSREFPSPHTLYVRT